GDGCRRPRPLPGRDARAPPWRPPSDRPRARGRLRAPRVPVTRARRHRLGLRGRERAGLPGRPRSCREAAPAGAKVVLCRPRGRGPAGSASAPLPSLSAFGLGTGGTGQAEEVLGTNTARAITLAKRARSVQPLSVEPLFIQALAAQLQRRYGETLGLLREATRL